jgi:hypothetical protein
MPDEISRRARTTAEGSKARGVARLVRLGPYPKTDGSRYGRHDHRNHGAKPVFGHRQRGGFVNGSNGRHRESMDDHPGLPDHAAGQGVRDGRGRQRIVGEAFRSFLVGSAWTPPRTAWVRAVSTVILSHVESEQSTGLHGSFGRRSSSAPPS